MTYQVSVTGLSNNITEAQVQDFFTFCGKVTTVRLAPSVEGQTATVEFEKAQAVKTAVLLSDSELNGSKVTIHADEKTLQAAEEAATSGAGGSGGGGSESPVRGEDDIGQEYKPRAAILAEYLSHGYVLGDKVIARGLDLDQKHGVSSRFTKFLTDLDNKYHVKDKAIATDSAYGLTDKAMKGQAKFLRYFDRALNTETGHKLHSYYTDLVKNAQDVHSEARRLADLKKEETSQSEQQQSTGSSTTATTHGVGPVPGEKPSQ